MSSNSFRNNCLAVLFLLSSLASTYILIIYYPITTWKDLLFAIVPWCLKRAIDINHAKSKERSRQNPSETPGFFSRKYPPLKMNEIRILALLPSKNRNAPLQGRFEIHDLGNENETSSKADQIGYEAVFYTKTTSPMGFIVIESNIFLIPLHLQRALFQLRHTHKERRLWADAICIKLPDLLELTTQILLFPRICKGATKAITWIGEPKEAEEEVYHPFLEALQRPSSILMLIRNGDLAHVSAIKVLVKPLRRWKLIARTNPRLCRELMLTGKISFKLGRYDFQGLLVALLMLHYNKAMRLPKSERRTDALLKPDASAALRVKALLIDCIEDVGDIDEKEQYDNGPFPKPWVALGSIEELLTMLRRSDKGSVSRKTLKNLSSLLDRAYSQSEQDPNPSYRSEAYNTYGTLIKQMKKATHGHRLFKTARLSRLGLASPGAQKKDVIFFVPEYSALLTLRAFHPLSTQSLDSQQYYTLTGACYMGDNKYWSKVHPHLTNVPLRTVYLMPATQEKEVQRNDKSSAKPSHFVTPSRVDPVRSNFGKDIMQRKTKSNIQVGNKTEKPHTAAMVDKRYRLSWTCTCGHKGLDHYIEHRPGAVRELLETFQEHGIKASMEACDLPQSNRSAARIVFERLGMTVANICTWIRFCILAWLGIEKWTSPSLPTMYPRLSDAVHNRSPSSKASNGPTNGISSSTSSANVDPNNSNQPLRTLTGLSTASQATPGRQKWRSSSSTTCTQVNSTNINIPEDFILLCIKVKRFLTNRHDLQVSTITRDRELFEALRREYHSKFRWAYCRFSFQTIQRMSFVKFTLHARQEVDGLVSDMPPETVKHYTCDPRKPDRTPPLGSDFLMHRFSSPKDCFQDNICLRQFPKRIRERPTPGVDPDLYTGWGVHLEQDMDLQRICLVLFFGIASAGTFGLVWGICKRSLQDGFSIASFVLGSEAIAVATLQLFLTFGAI